MHPVLFELGPFRFYSYGLLLALGFWVALELSVRRARARGLNAGRIQSVAFVALLAGLVGARAAYVFFNWEFFRADLIEVLRLDHGGLVFYGGFFAGVAGAFLYIKRFRMPMGTTLDVMVPPLVLAHAIGRIGCFLNGCCYGKVTALPWAVAVPPDGWGHHPTQLYESLALTAIFFILWAVEKRFQKLPGALVWVYGLSYGSWRFFNEFLRADSAPLALNLTGFQWMSLFIVILSAGWLRYALCRSSRCAP